MKIHFLCFGCDGCYWSLMGFGSSTDHTCWFFLLKCPGLCEKLRGNSEWRKLFEEKEKKEKLPAALILDCLAVVSLAIGATMTEPAAAAAAADKLLRAWTLLHQHFRAAGTISGTSSEGRSSTRGLLANRET